MNPNESQSHSAFSELLPWYVNETLDENERNSVHRHLESCRECRENVEALIQVQRAVRNDSTTPLVAPPRVNALLDAIDAGDRPATASRLPVAAIAASLLLAAVVVTVALTIDQPDVDAPVEFQTATSGSATAQIDYVIEIQFASGTAAAERERLFRSIEARDAISVGLPDAYRATVTIGAVSLADLERYTGELESHPEIATAEVVAVQLPLE